MREYAFFTNFPTPQKITLFNHLSDALGGRVVFFFYTRGVSKRKGWDVYLKDALFRYEILGARDVKVPLGWGRTDEGHFFLPTRLPSMSNFRKVVVSGGLTPSELAIALSATASGVPYVVWTGAPSIWFGGPWGLLYRVPVRFLLFSMAHAVVAATSMAAEHARRFGARRVMIAYTSFEHTRFLYERRHEGEQPRLLFVGRLVPFKRLDDLLRAMVALEDLTLDVVGEGPLKGRILRLADRLRLGDRVRFLPPVPYERMPEMYRRYDVLVLPSKDEVFGFVVVEALLSSTAAVVSDRVGAKDFLPDVAIFPVGNVRALAERLDRMRDPALREEVVRVGKGRVLREATPERWAETFKMALEGGLHP
ncbi:MAG: glycosyltransferase family 4 protein [Thermotogae bacterium]|nr:glycosyltransferase family 4 protein [Thermotogota bacterium]